MSTHRIDALSAGTFLLDGQEVEFGPGDTVLTYSGLKVWDAD